MGSTKWKKEALDKIAKLIMGQSPDSRFYTNEESGFRFLQGCAEFGKRFPETAVYCIQPTKLAPKDSILFSVRAPVGKVNLADQVYCIGRGLAAIVPQEVEDQYLYQYFLFKGEEIRNYSQGSTFEAINSQELKKISFDFPESRTEQANIAAVLSSIDRAIEQTESLIAKQQRIKRGLLHDLLTKGIDENGAIRSEATHGFKDSPLGRIPKGWDVFDIDYLSERVFVGLATSVTPFYRETGVPIIRNLNIKEGYFDEEVLYLDRSFCSRNESKAVQTDDVLIVRTGSNLGLSCLVPERLSGGQTFTTLVIRTKKRLLSPHYLVNHINSVFGQREIESLKFGGGKSNLNAGEVIKYRIACPPIDEQNIIQRIFGIQETERRHSIMKLEKLKKLKTGLMQDLLTGKVSVNSRQTN